MDSIIGNQGGTVRGQDVAYFGGTPAGYTSDPQEVINYAEAHDNRPFWDYVQSQAPFDTASRIPPKATLAERIRMQNLGMSLVVLGQGVPFFHAGMDMLRSKSCDEDSYDYGDWFNKLDFTYESNNWGVQILSVTTLIPNGKCF
jgi:pullulanase/glycogen debranching enzyme